MMNDKTSTPQKMSTTKNKNGKSALKRCRIPNPSVGAILLVFKLSLSSSIALNVSSHSLRNFLLMSSLLSLSAASKTLSYLSLTSNAKKRLVLDSPDIQIQDKEKAHCIEPTKKQESKLAAYKIDWFNSTSTKSKCLKQTSDKNLPVTQEGQLTFLLNKYQTSKIKMAFADALGKVGNTARKYFYPLPHRKDKLICNFLELIYDGKSLMIDNSKDSFR
jgi:hypothetical protein